MKALAFAFLGLVLWLPSSWAADYAVHVALVDHAFVTPERLARTEKFLAKRYPYLELRPIYIEVPSVLTDPASSAEVREKVKARLAEIPFGGGQQVRLLIVNAPGESDADGAVVRDLGRFGASESTSAAELLSDTLTPLKGHLAPYARVALLGFKSLGGATSAAQARAAGFLNEFGATDGSLYGLTTPGRREGATSVERPLLVRFAQASLVVGTTVAALALFNGEPGAMFSYFVGWSTGTFGALAAGTFAFERLKPWLSALTLRRDYGRVVNLQNGRVTSTRSFSALRRRRVFNCAYHLAR